MKKILFIIGMLVLPWFGCRREVPHFQKVEERREHFVNVVDEVSGKNRLVINYFGSPPLLLKKGVIKIQGYSLDVYRVGHEEDAYSTGGGEIDPYVIVDYSDLKKGAITITTCTWDPREPYVEDVSFIEISVKLLSDGKISVTRRILLKPEQANKARIDTLFAEILAENEKGHKDAAYLEQAAEIINRDLAHLRNISLDHADEILKRMQSLPHLAGDCACEPMKNGYLMEVEAIKEILHEHDRINNDSNSRERKAYR